MNLFDRLRRSFTGRNASGGAPSGVIIEVADVTPAKTPLPEIDYGAAVDALLANSVMPPVMRMVAFGTASTPAVNPRVEACSQRDGRLVANVQLHPFVAAVHLAFDEHRPLVLSPDMLWLLVAQGFANHVNANAEALRPQFVAHPGRKTIEVRRDNFVKGSPANPWPEVFEEFSHRIREHIGAATHDILLPRFSTTSPTEKAAAEIVLMDAMQTFFDFTLLTLCGIPQIVLQGTQQDWQLLAERTRALGQFGLAWWTDTLAPILDEFVHASGGEVNKTFWQSICKVDGGSGGPYFNGWFTAFFPYLHDWESGRALELNPWAGANLDLPQRTHVHADEHEPRMVLEDETAADTCLRFLYGADEVHQPPPYSNGLTAASFPSGLARAPFLWRYFEQTFEMEFLAGFVGVRQDAHSFALRPEIGWAVREAGEPAPDP